MFCHLLGLWRSKFHSSSCLVLASGERNLKSCRHSSIRSERIFSLWSRDKAREGCPKWLAWWNRHVFAWWQIAAEFKALLDNDTSNWASESESEVDAEEIGDKDATHHTEGSTVSPFISVAEGEFRIITMKIQVFLPIQMKIAVFYIFKLCNA
jgi:hypothetical protein